MPGDWFLWLRRLPLAYRRHPLASLADIEANFRIVQRHARGHQQVPLEAIGGSLNRTATFDHRFRPTPKCDHLRLARITSALIAGVEFAPVELVLVQGLYYVVDGHHRVAAARALKRATIAAVVTEWIVEERQT
ncbi:MAG: ParB N-terminal domain-containing protein [Chloroflexi bacterium]|nr:ParB N-terminal domain-containing protein [Chloroflexota bacterium]